MAFFLRLVSSELKWLCDIEIANNLNLIHDYIITSRAIDNKAALIVAECEICKLKGEERRRQKKIEGEERVNICEVSWKLSFINELKYKKALPQSAQNAINAGSTGYGHLQNVSGYMQPRCRSYIIHRSTVFPYLKEKWSFAHFIKQ